MLRLTAKLAAGPYLLSFPCLSVFICGCFLCAESPKKLDPGAWGADHVGKPVPEFLGGDECLFCHRNDIGPKWSSNRHGRTVRDLDDNSPGLAALKNTPAFKPFAEDVKFVLGNERRQRFLKPSPEFGKLELLSVQWQPGQGKLAHTDKPHWQGKEFGDRCAGCHATGVDVTKRAFAARSLDCYVCHGEVTPEHSTNTALVYLSRKRNDLPRVVTSICAQCHVRTGKSKSSGLPYANNFIAGDNLFRDFQVDFSDTALKALGPADRHVMENIRDVVVRGQESVTCLSCHDIHKPAGKKHHRVVRGDLCVNCHNPTGSMKERKPYEVHSPVCEY